MPNYTDPTDDLRDALALIWEAAEQHGPLDGGETATRRAEAVVELLARLGEKPGRRVLRFVENRPNPNEWRAYSGGLKVAWIFQDTRNCMTPEHLWSWAVQGGLYGPPDVCRLNGTAPTLEAAKRDVAENFRKWVAWAEF